MKRRSILQAAGAASAITVATAAAMTKGDPKKIAQLPVLLSGPDKLTVSVWMMPGDEHRVVARRPREILAAA